MGTKRLAIGTVVGGIAMFAVGYLIWDITFDYYAALLAAAGIAREPQLLWVLAASNVPFAALVTLALKGVVHRRLEGVSRLARLWASWFGLAWLSFTTGV